MWRTYQPPPLLILGSLHQAANCHLPELLSFAISLLFLLPGGQKAGVVGATIYRQTRILNRVGQMLKTFKWSRSNAAFKKRLHPCFFDCFWGVLLRGMSKAFCIDLVKFLICLFAFCPADLQEQGLGPTLWKAHPAHGHGTSWSTRHIESCLVGAPLPSLFFWCRGPWRSLRIVILGGRRYKLLLGFSGPLSLHRGPLSCSLRCTRIRVWRLLLLGLWFFLPVYSLLPFSLLFLSCFCTLLFLVSFLNTSIISCLSIPHVSSFP